MKFKKGDIIKPNENFSHLYYDPFICYVIECETSSNIAPIIELKITNNDERTYYVKSLHFILITDILREE
jgi:hypothetical protein